MIYVIGQSPGLVDLPGFIKICTPEFAIEQLQDERSIEVDTETDGLCPHINNIIALQFGNQKDQFVIDVRTTDIQQFKPLLESKLCLVANGGFDYKMLKSQGILLNKLYDVMIANQVIFNGIMTARHSLAAMCKTYLDYAMDKTSQMSFADLKGAPFTAKHIMYAAEDVAHLHSIARHQKKYIDKYELQQTVKDECEAILPLADIEYNGLYINSNSWLDVTKKVEAIYDDMIIDMDEHVLSLNLGYKNKAPQLELNFDADKEMKQRKLSINYASPAQALDLLRRKGLPINSTDALVLESYESDETVAKLLKIRKAEKQLSTYGRSFLEHRNKKTHRFHTSFLQIKQTFRMGSSNPNIQNIPRSNAYRNCFEPRPGFVWLSVDYSGQEMRLMADFSEEMPLINAINEGKDAHCFVGSMMFEREILKSDPLRTEAKTVNFGKPYGMGPKKLATKLGSNVQHAKKILRMHEAKFPKLDAYLKERGQFACQHGYVVTNEIHKGRRWFPEINNILSGRYDNLPEHEIRAKEGSVARQAGNLGIQGTGAVMMKKALVEIRRDILPHFDAYMVSTVHDESNFEVREDQAEELGRQVAQRMEDVGNRYVKHVRMTADITISEKWNKG